MFRPRIIPVLLLKGKGLVKTQKFSNPVYIGDPINAVKIFNDLNADELVFLDITASNEKRCISIDLVRQIGDEAFMPFSVGGGIRTLEQAKQLFKNGAEKIVLNSILADDLNLVRSAADVFGSQSIIASIDVKKEFITSKYRIRTMAGSKKQNVELISYIKSIEMAGAGEIMINSIDRDGTAQGYDIELVKLVTANVNIPVIACGGASSLMNMAETFHSSGVNALAAGSMFVFHGQRKGVLINYPDKKEVKKLFNLQHE